MEQMTKKTEIFNTKQESRTAQRIIYAIFGLIEAILAFRLIFKLLGANPDNGFVHSIYAVSQFFVGIFEGIFPRITVFEPATLIAMVVIALIAWVVLKLIKPRIGNYSEKTEYTGHDNQTK